MPKFMEIREIPLGDIEIGKSQVRLRDVGQEINELADSIRKVGLLEPIVVSPSSTPGKYEIITGQRRFLAHKTLNKDTILAAILDERVDETTAKVLSVTENLVRKDLNQRDLIDACTYLFRKYGSIRQVADETGLPYDKVSRYVKYEQLIPELRKLVDGNQVKLQTALRAQKAASVQGTPEPTEAVKFAMEMEPFSGAQQQKVVQEREENPDKSADQVIENAKSGGRVTQIVVTLTSNVHTQLRQYAENVGTNVDDAARMLIESALTNEGFLKE